MREIKFRAYEHISDIMDYGNGELSGYMEYNTSPTGTVKDIMSHNYQELTWMQYTGLKDKYGKEIYEGDILKYYNDTRMLVSDDKGSYKVVGNPKVEARTFVEYNSNFGAFTVRDYDKYLFQISCKSEVIGNIYENRELIDDCLNQ